MMYWQITNYLNWRSRFSIRFKLGNLSFAVVSVLVLVCFQFSQCIQLTRASSGSYDSSGRWSPSVRNIFEHGIFRHDKPLDPIIQSPFPPRSDISGSTKDGLHQTACQNANGCHSDTIPSFPPADNRDRYTFVRSKRSVTSLNFHPKPRDESRSIDLRPLRIFKYITEDDVLKRPNSEKHITIFQSLDSRAVSNETNHQQVIGGAKVNLKSKLNKSSNDGGNNNTTNSQVINNQATSNASDSESKSQIKNSPSPKPENIQIFRPSLAIRKNNNKTSLIPSGNHPHAQATNVNSITTSVTTAHSESTDPNSSTVNDRSLIHNLLFDAVVMLNEEGQKQLLHQQHQSVEPHREKTSSNSGGDDEITNMSATPSSTFTSSESERNGTISKTSPIIRSSLPITNNTSLMVDDDEDDDGNGNAATSMASGLVEKLIQTINATIAENKDNVIFKIKTKSNKGNKKSKAPRRLDEDDIEEDGSERSRRSPFRMPGGGKHSNVQRRGQALPQVSKGGQLVRAALFRRTSIPRVGSNGKIFPRLLNPIPAPTPMKPFVARTILPMKPMPFVKQSSRSMTMIPGLIGPGPVGPPIAAIKVTNMGSNKKMMFPSPGPDMVPGASRAVYSYKPLPSDLLLNEESSYYSPTYKRFKKRFHNQMSNIMDSQRDLEDTIHRLEVESSRYPHSRHVGRPRSRSPSRSNRHQNNDRERTRDRDMERDRDRHFYDREGYDRDRDIRDRDRDREREREREQRDRDRDRERERDRDRDRERERERDRERDRDRQSSRTERHQDRLDRNQQDHHRQLARSKKISSNPKYAYPKNAENIQDILKYFDKEAPPPFGPPGRSDRNEKSGSALPSRKPSHHHQGMSLQERQGQPKLADLSGEFRDVHASLLKDIKEFARRPNLFNGAAVDIKSPFESIESGTALHHDDPIGDIFGPQPKPVRDLVKPDLFSLENIRERIAFKRGKLHGKYRDKDHGKEKDQGDDHKNDHKDNGGDDDFFDRPSRHNTHDDNDHHSTEQVKHSLFSKEEFDSPKSERKTKQKETADDTHTIFPSSHYNQEKDAHREHSSPFPYHSAEFPKHAFPSTKPIVLKRPHEQHYRVRDAEPKKKPVQDYFWNTFTAGFEKAPQTPYDAPLVIKSPNPSVLHPYNPYNAFGSASGNPLGKPMSIEDEDIVEIHTGGPGGAATGVQSFPGHGGAATGVQSFPGHGGVAAGVQSFPGHGGAATGLQSYHGHGGTPTGVQSFPVHDSKQEKLQKMYMDVLHQKLQLEAALLRPQALPVTHTQAMSHSQMPQHSPMQLPRVPPQIAYPGSTGNIASLTGLGGMRRKKPMRMKIHIYPNGHDGIEQGIEAANLLAAGGFGTSGFSASNPPGVVAPPPSKDAGVRASESAIPSGPGSVMHASPTGYGHPLPGHMPTGPSHLGSTPGHMVPHQSHTGPHQGHTGPMQGHMGPMSGHHMSHAPTSGKNKNVVLHLHVHRRNDFSSPLELEAEGSSSHPVTVKPLTYKEIFDEQEKENGKEPSKTNGNLKNHRVEEEPLNSRQDTQEREEPHDDEEETERERDKSVSMEVPIRDEKIEQVLHSFMKLRNKPADNRKRRS